VKDESHGGMPSEQGEERVGEVSDSMALRALSAASTAPARSKRPGGVESSHGEDGVDDAGDTSVLQVPSLAALAARVRGKSAGGMPSERGDDWVDNADDTSVLSLLSAAACLALRTRTASPFCITFAVLAPFTGLIWCGCRFVEAGIAATIGTAAANNHRAAFALAASNTFCAARRQRSSANI
jgi:hypothetical protein